ncbi:hypothetical protein BESB_022800 [Besnoitia besnoiti]|uniref:PH domain-containing protein n=1 Tax=Besnoitia besnoiti TaxID=94643 RepID=A0A2A9LZH1_BESBE|nr:hypothetical protein BESB_022800 [Besnoitia besnoiti]PFH31788.1 hypothetical protein BESB_022800 [Besnoitia besnoiti]
MALPARFMEAMTKRMAQESGPPVGVSSRPAEGGFGASRTSKTLPPGTQSGQERGSPHHEHGGFSVHGVPVEGGVKAGTGSSKVALSMSKSQMQGSRTLARASKAAMQRSRPPSQTSAAALARGPSTVPDRHGPSDGQQVNREEQVERLRTAILQSRVAAASKLGATLAPASLRKLLTPEATDSAYAHTGPPEASGLSSRQVPQSRTLPPAPEPEEKNRSSAPKATRQASDTSKAADSWPMRVSAVPGLEGAPSSEILRPAPRPAELTPAPEAAAEAVAAPAEPQGGSDAQEPPPAGSGADKPAKKGGWLAKARAAPPLAAETGLKQPVVLKVTKRKAPVKAKKAVLRRVAFPGAKRAAAAAASEEEDNDSEPEPFVRKDTWGALTQELAPGSTPPFLRSWSEESGSSAEEDLNLTGSHIFPSMPYPFPAASIGGEMRVKTTVDKMSTMGSENLYRAFTTSGRGSLPALGSLAQRPGSQASAEAQVLKHEVEDEQVPSRPALTPAGSVAPLSGASSLSAGSEAVDDPFKRPAPEEDISPILRESLQAALLREERRRLIEETGGEKLGEWEEEVPPRGAQGFGRRPGPSASLREQDSAEEDGEAEEGEDELSRPPTSEAADTRRTQKKRVKRKKQAAATSTIQVEPFVAELAATEDFDREAMVQIDLVPPPPEKGLSPAVERLRQERVELARWIRRLRDGRTAQKTGLRPEAYVKPGQRRGIFEVNLTDNYPADTFEPRLEEPLEARGDRMEEMLIKDTQMPSTKVWQLEQTSRRRLMKMAQQRHHINLLQRALRKARREVRQATQEGRGEEADSDASSDDSAPSALEAERVILQEQCDSLIDRVRLETANRESYKRAMLLAQSQKELTAEKYKQLRRQLKAAYTVTRMEQAKQEEKQESIDDLKARLAERNDVLRRATSTSEQYEYELLKLQRRYEALASYFQESQEKASSYQEGLREAQSSLEHEVALLQIERNKTLNLSERLREQDAAIERMEIELRMERDKVLSREKAIQELRDSLAENSQLLTEARNELVVGNAQLEEERRHHSSTRSQVLELQAELAVAQQSVELLKGQKAIAMEQEEAFQHLHQNFLLLLESSQKQSDALEDAIEEVAQRKDAALQLLQTALEAIQRGIESREKGQDMDAKLLLAQSELDGAVSQLRQEHASELASLNRAQSTLAQENEKHRALVDELRREADRHATEVKALRQQVEEARQREADMQLAQLKMERKNARLEKRAVKFYSAQGRRGDTSIVPFLKRMQQGSPMEKANVGKRKVTKKFVRLTKDMTIVWEGGKEDALVRFKPPKAIRVQDIVSVSFGTDSAACRARIAASKKREILPWRCFEVQTPAASYLFTAPTDDVAAAWVVGLGRLAAEWTDAPNIKTERELCVKRTKMKLQRHCQKNNITQKQMWLQAINRTPVRRRTEARKILAGARRG